MVATYMNRFKYGEYIKVKWIPEIYKSFIFPKIFYGIEFWSYCNDKTINKLQYYTMI